jgi:hypothetical protein
MYMNSEVTLALYHCEASQLKPSHQDIPQKMANLCKLTVRNSEIYFKLTA